MLSQGKSFVSADPFAAMHTAVETFDFRRHETVSRSLPVVAVRAEPLVKLHSFVHVALITLRVHG